MKRNHHLNIRLTDKEEEIISRALEKWNESLDDSQDKSSFARRFLLNISKKILTSEKISLEFE